jgi:tripartite-type tricarboxylate transporter receptor subunit TctC
LLACPKQSRRHLGGSSTHIAEVILKSRPLYNPVKDLEPISNLVLSAFAIAIYPGVPARTLKEFIDLPRLIPASCPMGTPAWAR